jgi:hypothetical protein
MATKIKDTPYLTGEDARRFHATVRDNATKSVTKEEAARIARNYRKMVSIESLGFIRIHDYT